MLRRVLAWAAAVLIGALLGAATAWGAISFGAGNFVERYGAWTHSRAAGSEAAGPYTRAVIARTGLLALSAREALYFNLSKDDAGAPLREDCIYELSGAPLDARWWSVTLYAADNFLVRNEDHAAAIASAEIGEEHAWQARISSVRGNAEHWLSSRGAGRGFSLTLRVYNPGLEFRPSAQALPTLARISCVEP